MAALRNEYEMRTLQPPPDVRPEPNGGPPEPLDPTSGLPPAGTMPPRAPLAPGGPARPLGVAEQFAENLRQTSVLAAALRQVYPAREPESAQPPVPRVALTQAEACAALGCSDEWFVEHVRPGLAAVRGGRKRLFPVADLERWAAERGEEVLGG